MKRLPMMLLILCIAFNAVASGGFIAPSDDILCPVLDSVHASVFQVIYVLQSPIVQINDIIGQTIPLYPSLSTKPLHKRPEKRKTAAPACALAAPRAGSKYVFKVKPCRVVVAGQRYMVHSDSRVPGFPAWFMIKICTMFLLPYLVLLARSNLPAAARFMRGVSLPNPVVRDWVFLL